jgi:hypothetical protein
MSELNPFTAVEKARESYGKPVEAYEDALTKTYRIFDTGHQNPDAIAEGIPTKELADAIAAFLNS